MAFHDQNNDRDIFSRDNRDEVSLKPQTSSMIFKPKTPSLLPKSAKPTNNQNILDPVPSLLPSGPSLPPASGKVIFSCCFSRFSYFPLWEEKWKRSVCINKT